MKAIVQDRYGGPEGLSLRDVPAPKIGDSEVLIRVHAAGVNPADWAVMRGEPLLVRLAMGLRRPGNGILGSDVAGTVEEIGAKVKRFKRGEAVFGCGRATFAELAAAPEKHLVHKPEALSFAAAAALPMAALVALQALRDQGELSAGQRLLVTGAGGGIGSFAVQIGKAFGAHVTAVCSSTKLALVRSLGADVVIDAAAFDLAHIAAFDVILDNAGRHNLAQLRSILRPAGTLVPNNGEMHKRIAGSLGNVLKARCLSIFVRQRLRPFLSLPNLGDLSALEALVVAGKLVPALDRSFPLHAAAEALSYVGAGKAIGKVTVTAGA